MRVRFDVEEEAVQFALSFGGDVEVMEPHELRYVETLKELPWQHVIIFEKKAAEKK